MQQAAINARMLPTVDRLRQVLSYEPESGRLTWLVRRGVNVKAGDAAGTDHEGYVRIKVDGRLLLAHRIAWAMHSGCWPHDEIDHIDGNKSNNCITNLRCVGRLVNMQNQRVAPSSNRSCGLIGATWLKRKGCWAAQISVAGRKRHLGVFDSAEKAHGAYVAAKRLMHEGCTL